LGDEPPGEADNLPRHVPPFGYRVDKATQAFNLILQGHFFVVGIVPDYSMGRVTLDYTVYITTLDRLRKTVREGDVFVVNFAHSYLGIGYAWADYNGQTFGSKAGELRAADDQS
jgi:hypothetical protein